MGLFGIKKVAAKSMTDYEDERRQWFMLNQAASSFLEGDDYENVFGNVTALTRSASAVEPFLKDEEGNKYEGEHNVLTTLYRPNRDMDDRMFREALFLLYLMKPKFYILVHHKGVRRKNGTIDAEKITGYTFLENVYEQRNPNGTVTYRVGSKTYEEGEVLTFFGLNPNSLMSGYSPMKAVRRWTRVQDFISDSQTAFFRNGAVPAGMFIINANTEQQFKDIKRMMQKKTRGAKNNNNVLYNWRQPDPSGGTATQDQIIWVPFNTTNKDLALKDLTEIIEKKQNDAFGVSPVIKGDVDQTTYASATTVEKYFVKYTLQPLLLAVWRRFSHELARVTGGFDYSIDFHIDIPVVGDELVQKAEATKTNVESFLLLADKYEKDSIVDALELPESFKKLVPLGDGKKSTEKKDDPGTIEKDEVEPDEPEQEVSGKALADESRKSAEEELLQKLDAYTDEQINQVIDHYIETGEMPDTTDEALEALVSILAASIFFLMLVEGRREQSAAVSLAKDALRRGVPVYVVSERMRDQYATYLQKVARSYNDVLRREVHSAIEKALLEGTTRENLKDTLMKLGLGEYPARRLANSEINRASNNAALDAYRQIEAEMPDHYFVKIWVTDGVDPCPTCLALDGTETHIDAPFMTVGQHIHDDDGHDFENTFVEMQTADAHPNCHCHLKFLLRSY